MDGSINVGGSLTLDVRRGSPRRVAAPRLWRLKNWFRKLSTGELFLPAWLKLVKLIGPRGLTFVSAELRGEIRRADGTVVDLGTLGRHLVTTAGKQFLASAFDNTVEPEILKYHGFGTGTTAAAIGDTALQTELTTEYATNSTRPTGSQAHSGATYTTVGTLAPDAAGPTAITEWGLFSADASGTLWDRQVFSAVNLTSADTLAVTYVLTVA